MKKQIKLLLILSCLVPLASCKKEPVKKNTITLNQISVYSFHSALQDSYLNDNFDSISKYANGRVTKDKPVDLTLSFDSSFEAPLYKFYIANNSEFKDAQIYETTQKEFKLSYLNASSTYYWKVSAEECESAISSFVTSSSPRNFDIDKVDNVRDMGGWITSSSKYVKQNLIYRGGRLNNTTSDDVVSPKVSKKGLDVLKNELKIKTEIDLRELSSNGYPSTPYSLIDGANYISCPMEFESKIKNNPAITENNESIKKVFETFGDISSYPIYFHCSVGTDRTGYIAFLLNGLLGVKKEDLYRDYLFSNFAAIKGERTIDEINEYYVNSIEEINKNSLQEKIEYYLENNIGVNKETLNKIKEIML